MNPHGRSAPDAALLIRLQREGLSQAKIGAKLGFSQSTISNVLRKAGLGKAVGYVRRADRKSLTGEEQRDEDGYAFPEPYHIPGRVARWLARPVTIQQHFRVPTVKDTKRIGRHQL